MNLEHEELTDQIIGAAIEVHKAHGPGYVEAIYENALALELRARDIPFQRQLAIHFAITRSYLRAAGRQHGLLLNFARPTLEVKRVIASERPNQ